MGPNGGRSESNDGRPDAVGLSSALTFEAERTRVRIEALERDLAALHDATADSPDDEHDPEGAGVAFERQQVAALLAAATARLRDLVAARARLDAGTYGACEDCGEAIPMERLLALPAVTRCAACAVRAGE